MNTDESLKDPRIPAGRLAEAGVWIARLQDDERDASVEAGLREWLKADALNPRAFELCTEVWEDSQGLRKLVGFPSESQSRRRGWRSPSILLAVASSAVLVLAVTLTWLHFQRAIGLVTGVGEQRSLVLEDGTRVFLNTRTRIITHYDKTARRVELEAGEAWFEVAKRPSWPFIVTAGSRSVTALGTSFIVRFDPDETAVTLIEGSVSVSPAVNTSLLDSLKIHSAVVEPQRVTLTAGQRLNVAVNGSVRLDEPPLNQVTAWRRGEVIMDDLPLEKAASEMNRYSAIKIKVRDAAAADIPVSGLFQAGDSMSFARAVSLTYGLEVIEQNDEIILDGLPRPNESRPPSR